MTADLRLFPADGGRGYAAIRGDGTLEDLATMQAAIRATAGGVVEWPAGTWPLAGTLGAAAGVTIVPACGRGATLHDPAGNTILLNLTDLHDVTVIGMRLTGSGTSVVDGRGALKATGATRALVREVTVEGAGSCGLAGYMVDSRIIDLTVLGGAEHSLYLSTGTARVLVRGLMSKDAGITGESTVNAVKLADCRDVILEQYIIDGARTSGVALTATMGPCVVGDGVIRNCGYAGLRVLDGAVQPQVGRILFEGNPNDTLGLTA